MCFLGEHSTTESHTHSNLTFVSFIYEIGFKIMKYMRGFKLKWGDVYDVHDNMPVR